LGHANISAATKRQTDIVFPNRRGVDILLCQSSNKVNITWHKNDQKVHGKNSQDFLVNILPIVTFQ